MIDAILYINLAHRADRNAHIQAEIAKMNVSPEKIHRIDAIKHTNGVLGCGLSHIKALEYALKHSEWNTILVLEDDFTFHSNNSDEICKSIHNLITYDREYDMCVLSYNHNCVEYKAKHKSGIVRILQSQTSSSYIIRSNYIPTLLANFKESTELLQRKHIPDYCIDIYWKRLQRNDKWYSTKPALGFQCEGFSDVEQAHVKYNC